jgi:23S rRNA (uracil1939-C5)-methyltransferase
MVILQAEKWVHGGYTIARFEEKTYFIKGAVPGERVKCKIIEDKKEHAFVIVEEVLEKSSERIANECTSFPECGGCSFWNISYEEEKRIKKELFIQELAHKKIEFEISKIQFHSGPEKKYRNTVQVKVDSRKIGFYKEKSREIIEFPKQGCLLLPDEFNQLFKVKKKFPSDGKLRLSDKIYEYGRSESKFIVLNKEIKIPTNGFFQINRFLIEPWVKSIQSIVKQKASIITEFFCGSGLISLFVGEDSEKMYAFELESKAIEAAKKNAKNNSLHHIEFYTLDLYKKKPTEKYLLTDFWIANPPRSGLGNLLLEQVKQYKPKYFLYSSCNYSTLVRDLKYFIEYEYAIESIEIFDFFPRTPYFETLVLLKKITPT